NEPERSRLWPRRCDALRPRGPASVAAYVLIAGHLMHDLTADHGHVGGNVADCRFGYGQRISTQNREVRELAGFERTCLWRIPNQAEIRGAGAARIAHAPSRYSGSPSDHHGFEARSAR